MMNANELRLGNLHIFKMRDKFEEPQEWDEICVIDAQDIVYLSNNPDDPDYEPIPLTEQWLLGFGGIDTDCFIFIKAKSKEIKFSYSSKIVETGVRNGWYCKRYEHIKYVHQLQNLVHALTGEELTLKK